MASLLTFTDHDGVVHEIELPTSKPRRCQ